MYISMPEDFFVPVMYDYKKNLDLLDENNKEMNRESSKRSKAKEADNKTLNDKGYTYVNENIYVSVDDEYIYSDVGKQTKYDKSGCSKEETKENHDKSIKEKIYVDIDDEYVKGIRE